MRSLEEAAIRDGASALVGALQVAPAPVLARLRRLPEAPALALFEEITEPVRKVLSLGGALRAWADLAQVLLVLMPTSPLPWRPHLHIPALALGVVLCDGGDRGWRGPRPAISEARVLGLLAMDGPRRVEAWCRVARALARGGKVEGFNVGDLALAMYRPDFASTLLDAYYERMERGSAPAAPAHEED